MNRFQSSLDRAQKKRDLTAILKKLTSPNPVQAQMAARALSSFGQEEVERAFGAAFLSSVIKPKYARLLNGNALNQLLAVYYSQPLDQATARRVPMALEPVMQREGSRSFLEEAFVLSAFAGWEQTACPAYLKAFVKGKLLKNTVLRPSVYRALADRETDASLRPQYADSCARALYLMGTQSRERSIQSLRAYPAFFAEVVQSVCSRYLQTGATYYELMRALYDAVDPEQQKGITSRVGTMSPPVSSYTSTYDDDTSSSYSASSDGPKDDVCSCGVSSDEL